MIETLTGAPAPSEPRPFHPPLTAETRLANGMRVIVAPRRGIPLVGAQIIFNLGAASDAADQLGLSYLTASLLSYGPQHSTSSRFAEALDAIGARFSGARELRCRECRCFGHDGIVSRSAAACERRAAPALLRSRRRGTRSRAYHQRSAHRLRVAEFARAHRCVSRAPTASSRTASPSPGRRSPSRSSRANPVVQLARSRLRPDERATMVLSGDFDEETGFSYARRGFGDWEGPSYVRVEDAARTLRRRCAPPRSRGARRHARLRPQRG